MIKPFKEGINGFQTRQKLNEIVDCSNNTERLQLNIMQILTGVIAIVTVVVIVICSVLIM